MIWAQQNWAKQNRLYSTMSYTGISSSSIANAFTILALFQFSAPWVRNYLALLLYLHVVAQSGAQTNTQ